MRALRPLLLIAVLLGAPVAAQAATVSPPGNSGISQYLEVVPTSGGGKPSDQSRSAKGSPLSARQRARLARSGTEGQQLAAVVAGTSPAGAVKKATRKKSKATKKVVPVKQQTVPVKKATKHRSALAAAFTTGGGGSGDGGLGIPLLAPMLGAALLVGAFALGRRRGGAGAGGGTSADAGPSA